MIIPIGSDMNINVLIEQKKKGGQHKCLTGRVVKFYSDRARGDIEKRITDATHSRNEENLRSAARSHYNGILKVLRGKLRDINRNLPKDDILESHVFPRTPRRAHRGVLHAQRLLKLSGVL